MKDDAVMITRLLKYVLLGAAIGLILMASLFVYEYTTAPQEDPKEIPFKIIEGSTATQIAQALSEAGIISRPWPFLVGYKLFFAPIGLKAGEYVINTPISSKEVLHILTEGKIILHAITIPEGLTRLEMAEHLAEAGFVDQDVFLKLTADNTLVTEWDDKAIDLEGYLFPETYHFPKETPESKIITTLVAQFEEAFSQDWKDRAEEIGFSIRDTVILASLIEKETSHSSERPLVSAVFHNRLSIRMKLDCDPTIVYALKTKGQYTGRLRTKDLKLDSPYNTYLHGGLPPGPIANPGRASLEAALFPTDVEYLYFVSKNDGSHHFSRTFREHQNAVNKYQRRR